MAARTRLGARAWALALLAVALIGAVVPSAAAAPSVPPCALGVDTPELRGFYAGALERAERRFPGNPAPPGDACALRAFARADIGPGRQPGSAATGSTRRALSFVFPGMFPAFGLPPVL